MCLLWKVNLIFLCLKKFKLMFPLTGKFYRFKSDKHPHTNMAKAALNMMTRTSAQDYVRSNIYMTVRFVKFSCSLFLM